jgi:hypothetical protein
VRYLALLYGAENEAVDPTAQAFADELARYERFDEFAGNAIVGGEALEPTGAGVTIRHAPDGPIVTDGVFTEASEVVGGFYVLEADDLDQAINLAQRIPAAEDGAVELRPLVEWFEERREPPAGAHRYLALLAGEESEADHPGTPAGHAAVAAHDRFGREAGEALLGGGALHPAETATVVRVRGGEVLVTEGTYAETTEIVGGLYLLWAGSPADAADLATRIPMGTTGVVQLRPIIELDA